MSGFGKLLMFLALVGAGTSGIVGYLIVGNQADTSNVLNQVKDQREIVKKDLKKTEGELETAKGTIASNEEKIQDLQGQTEDLKRTVRDKERSLTLAQTDLKEKETKLAEATGELDKIKEELGGTSPADLKSQVADLTGKVKDTAATNDELKVVVERLRSEVERRPAGDGEPVASAMPPGLSGKIAAVNKTWNFVVLSIGSADGALPGGELLVYRGDSYIGRVRITTTESKSSVADIIPEFTKARIMLGDDVIN